MIFGVPGTDCDVSQLALLHPLLYPCPQMPRRQQIHETYQRSEYSSCYTLFHYFYFSFRLKKKRQREKLQKVLKGNNTGRTSTFPFVGPPGKAVCSIHAGRNRALGKHLKSTGERPWGLHSSCRIVGCSCPFSWARALALRRWCILSCPGQLNLAAVKSWGVPSKQNRQSLQEWEESAEKFA